MTYGLLSELTGGRLREGRPECCQGALGASLLIGWDLRLPRQHQCVPQQPVCMLGITLTSQAL